MSDIDNFFKPKHPGYYLEKEMDKAELTIYTLAIALNLSQATLEAFINGRIRLTPELKVKCKLVFSLDLEPYQQKYDLFFNSGKQSNVRSDTKGYIHSHWDMFRKRGSLPE